MVISILKNRFLDKEQKFGALLARYLSPSKVITSVEFLRGREEQFRNLRKALYAPGRHALIYGYRGVGKSSMAQTVANNISSSNYRPILLGCEANDTYEKIICDLWEEAIGNDPAIEHCQDEQRVGVNLAGIGASKNRSISSSKLTKINSLNEAVRVISHISQARSGDLVVIIDEFDQITDPIEQQKFANLVKQISDQNIAAKFIICGIGDSVDALMDAHASSSRYFHTVSLDRLSYDARREIIEFAADKLNITIDETTLWRIAKISDGFPHYVHLIAEKLFWQVFEADNGMKVTSELFERSMIDACDAIEMQFKGPYETATRKYTNDYETILFAVADGHEFERNSSDIYQSYCRIMLDMDRNPLVRSKFNSRIYNLKTPGYASILSQRSKWYGFTEKVIRGYARLRAEQLGVDLETDHPIGRRKFL